MAAAVKVKKKKDKAKLKAGTITPAGIVDPPQSTFVPEYVEPTSAASSIISVREAAEHHQADSVAKENNEDQQTPSKNDKGSRVSLSSRTFTPVATGRVPSSASLLSPEPPRCGTGQSQTSPMGSAVSIRSKEAWSEVDIPPVRPSTSRPREPSAKNRPTSAVSKTLEKTAPAPLLGSPDMNLNHAYVPYLYARGCIAQMVEDMKNMKKKHFTIINDIETNYAAIEDKTQDQFQVFVGGLRGTYGGKVSTFRHVIQVHQLELQQKQQYWDEALLSLSDKNKLLLKEKKMLLIENRKEFDRLEKEKEDSVKDLTGRLDQKDSEHKIVLDELESEKTETERLQLLLAGGAVSNTASKSDMCVGTDAEAVTATSAVLVAAAAPTVVVTDMSEEERRRMEEEREEMGAGRLALATERNDMQAERDKWLADRNRFQAERASLQADLIQANTDADTWKAKYLAARKRQLELEPLTSQYAALLAQYQAVLDVATITSDADKNRADEKIEKAKKDKVDLQESKDQLAKDIENWENEFTAVNGRKPTVEDRTASADELYNSQREVDAMLGSLDAQVDTLEKLKRGEIPVAPAAAAAVIVPEPEVTTVTQLEAVGRRSETQLQVRVPDLEAQAQLEMTQAELESLYRQVAALKADMTELQNQNSSLKSERADLQAEVDKLNAIVLQLETTTAALQADVNKKDKLIAEMEKDMKEMLKKIAKLQKKLKAAQAQDGAAIAVDGDNEELEEEIERLEEEVNNLKDDKQALEDRIAELEASSDEPSSEDDVHDLTAQLSLLQQQLDEAEANLTDERGLHEMTRAELEALRQQLAVMVTEAENQKQEANANLQAAVVGKDAEIDNLKKKLADLEAEVKRLEEARLQNLPVDVAAEIRHLKDKLEAATKGHDESVKEKAVLSAEIVQLNARINSLQATNSIQSSNSNDIQNQLLKLKKEKEEEIKKVQDQAKKREHERVTQERKKIEALEAKINKLQLAALTSGGSKGGKVDGKQTGLQDKLREAKNENAQLKTRIRQLESEIKSGGGGGGGSVGADRNLKKHEKLVKELEKRLDNEMKKNKKNEENIRKKTEEITADGKTIKELEREVERLKAEMVALGAAAKEKAAAAEKIKNLEQELKKLKEENKTLSENYNTERVLRKKYYNMVEDMKGKIRVYCRVRPMSKVELGNGNQNVCKSGDEYSLSVESSRGPKDFQFDSIFMPDSSQEAVFEDTNNLIQSAVDGYNVCIFAYGQTGSGKTFTIIGDQQQKLPGIAPRAFDRIFELIEENKSKFAVKVSCYMLELYTDKLLDLFAAKGAQDHEKLEIKKDKKGMVFVHGSEIKNAKNAKELFGLFEEGNKTRHTASTKMNSESSRSHLIIGIILESTNLSNGQVLRGKLSLVDLAGSERAAKTGAGAEQLKEAMSINKSLSALGDVISALSSEQSFIPYRNNKLTMLMQDSLGGNAKTLMFVNVSPADYNQDETVISLTYASRVKLITNDAQKNADNKEVAKLKAMIAKLKRGEAVDPIDEDD